MSSSMPVSVRASPVITAVRPVLTPVPSSRRTTLEDACRYRKLEKIGKGSFGDVFRGMDVMTEDVVAIKVIDLESADEEIEEIRQEIRVLSECHCENITRYIASYTCNEELHIVMEYLGGGSVRDLLSVGPIDEHYCAIITREMLKALDYLHDAGKIHRDIKAANILLSTSGEPKMGDFGVTGQLTATMQRRATFVGTPYWMAPEVIQQSEYNEKADIWSIGITVYEMVTQEPPHHQQHPMKALFLIPKSPPPSLDHCGNASKLCRDFVALCCQKDPEKRPSVKELLKHKWIKNAKKTAVLAELLAERLAAVKDQLSEDDDDGVDDGEDGGADWDFTVKAVKQSPTRTDDDGMHGTVRRVPSTHRSDVTDTGTMRAVSPKSPDVKQSQPLFHSTTPITGTPSSASTQSTVTVSLPAEQSMSSTQPASVTAASSPPRGRGPPTLTVLATPPNINTVNKPTFSAIALPPSPTLAPVPTLVPTPSPSLCLPSTPPPIPTKPSALKNRSTPATPTTPTATLSAIRITETPPPPPPPEIPPPPQSPPPSLFDHRTATMIDAIVNTTVTKYQQSSAGGTVANARLLNQIRALGSQLQQLEATQPGFLSQFTEIAGTALRTISATQLPPASPLLPISPVKPVQEEKSSDAFSPPARAAPPPPQTSLFNIPR